ncbi:MAG: hypothetical protein Q7S33_05085 [Nanoarchaeota archaeon]|nr:hypothetical protein [Nanoarchaeota archaeon]
MINILSDQEVQGLIKIIDGELKGHWYTLGIKINHYSRLSKQLTTVKKLGLSKNKIALDYLDKLNLHEEVDNNRRTDYSFGDICYDTIYPNATGKLKAVLESRMEGGMVSSATYPFIPRQYEARSLLTEALSTLKESFK